MKHQRETRPAQDLGVSDSFVSLQRLNFSKYMKFKVTMGLLMAMSHGGFPSWSQGQSDHSRYRLWSHLRVRNIPSGGEATVFPAGSKSGCHSIYDDVEGNHQDFCLNFISQTTETRLSFMESWSLDCWGRHTNLNRLTPVTSVRLCFRWPQVMIE